jgi:hypothetical protein
VTIPNAEHLLEQADRLITVPGRGAPRQVDLRRAVSSAYYGVFHAVLTAAADEFVGRTRNSETPYGLCYRGIEHGTLRKLCSELEKPTLSAQYRRYQPKDGFGPDLKAFATSLVELQQRRHAADYDPLIRLKRSDALLAASIARSALGRLQRVPPDQRAVFLALLVFPPR